LWLIEVWGMVVVRHMVIFIVPVQCNGEQLY